MGNTQANQKEIFQDNSINLTQLLKDDPINTLLVNSYTWSKDSHGLYDYEGGNNIKKQHIKVTTKCLVQRKSDQMHISSYEDYKKDIVEDYKSQQHPILGIVQTKNNEYFLKNFPHIPQNPFNLLKNQKKEQDSDYLNENSMWLIVRSLKQVKGNKHGCLLQEDDYIKLGRVKFRIKEISSSQNKPKINNELLDKEKSNANNSVLETNRNPVPVEKINQQIVKKSDTQGTVAAEELQSSEVSIKDEGKTCRICYSDTYRKDNPLLTPCKCSGSVQYVHIKCLQQWLQNKITTKSSPYSIAYMWKNLQCELCGHKYPHIFQHNGNDYQAFEMKKPNSPYIIMEFLNKDTNECKGVHVISMNNKNQIKIGRGSDSDMKVTDISVSRCHGFINYQNGNFYLQDHNSKFGTLALIKNGINISPETNKIAIQVNRTVFYFYMKTISNFSFCCAGKQAPLKNQNFLLNNQNKNLEKTQNFLKENQEIVEKIKEQEKKKFFDHTQNLQQQNQKPMKKKFHAYRDFNKELFGKENFCLPVEEEKQQNDIIIKLKSSQLLNPNDIQHANNLNLNNNSNNPITQQQQEREQKIRENYEKFNQLFPQSKSEIKQKNRLKKSQANQNYLYNDIDFPNQNSFINNNDDQEDKEDKKMDLDNNNQEDFLKKYENFYNNDNFLKKQKNKQNKINQNYSNKLNKSDLKEVEDNGDENLPDIQMQKYQSEQHNNDLHFLKENWIKNQQKMPETKFISSQAKKPTYLDKNQPKFPNGQFNEIQDLKQEQENIKNNQLYNIDDDEYEEQKGIQQQNGAEINQLQNQSQKEQLGRFINIKKMSSNFNPREEIIQFQD